MIESCVSAILPAPCIDYAAFMKDLRRLNPHLRQRHV
jgi:hypothetical protein